MSEINTVSEKSKFDIIKKNMQDWSLLSNDIRELYCRVNDTNVDEFYDFSLLLKESEKSIRTIMNKLKITKTMDNKRDYLSNVQVVFDGSSSQSESSSEISDTESSSSNEIIKNKFAYESDD